MKIFLVSTCAEVRHDLVAKKRSEWKVTILKTNLPQTRLGEFESASKYHSVLAIHSIEIVTAERHSNLVSRQHS